MPLLILSTSLTSKANIFLFKQYEVEGIFSKEYLEIKKLSLTKTRYNHININESVEHHNLVLLQSVFLTRFTVGGLADILIFYRNQKPCPKPVC